MSTDQHGLYAGVLDVARNGVDEVIRLRAENELLRDALYWWMYAHHVSDDLPPGRRRELAERCVGWAIERAMEIRGGNPPNARLSRKAAGSGDKNDIA